MKLEFKQIGYLRLGINVDFGISREELIEELKKQKWTSWGDSVPMGHENYNWKFRYRLDNKNIDSPLLKEISNFLHSAKTYDLLLDALYDYGPAFQGIWSISKEQMRNWAIFHMEYMLDKPGFKLDPHNDYRRLVGAGMIYLADRNDPNISTTFYGDRQLNDPYIIRTGYGMGWFAANVYENYHSGHNASDQDRYSILLGLTIKAPEEYERK